MQPTAIYTSHIIAKYVLETNILTTLEIYAIHAKYLIDLHQNVYIYMYTYAVAKINQVKMGTVHIFDIYH